MTIITRRGFLTGLASVLATGVAPAIITKPGILMPVKKIVTPNYALSKTYNILAAGQDEFGEMFYPTTIIKPDNFVAGSDIRTKLIENIRDIELRTAIDSAYKPITRDGSANTRKIQNSGISGQFLNDLPASRGSSLFIEKA